MKKEGERGRLIGVTLTTAISLGNCANSMAGETDSEWNFSAKTGSATAYAPIDAPEILAGPSGQFEIAAENKKNGFHCELFANKEIGNRQDALGTDEIDITVGMRREVEIPLVGKTELDVELAHFLFPGSGAITSAAISLEKKGQNPLATIVIGGEARANISHNGDERELYSFQLKGAIEANSTIFNARPGAEVTVFHNANGDDWTGYRARAYAKWGVGQNTDFTLGFTKTCSEKFDLETFDAGLSMKF